MLAQNLKYLRAENGISQQELADILSLPRSSISDYERGRTEPSIENLIKISERFDVKIDHLIKTDLSRRQLETVKNESFKVLTITVDSQHRSNIELVQTKAAAGYQEHFTDPEYIRELPKIYFPVIPQGTFRGFEIKGDSMLPVEPGSIVICSYVEKLKDIKKNKTYVIVSKTEGVVYKRVIPYLEGKKLLLTSDNAAYDPYNIALEDIAEVWQYYAHLSFTDAINTSANQIQEKLNEIQRKLNEVHKVTVK